jgi:ABC-type sugar transport system ATPase subunit
MRTEIKELHQRLKTTTVYVTHDQIEAMTMADKIVVMHDGALNRSVRRWSCTIDPTIFSSRALSAHRP